jgi:hypothetical protein
MFNKVYVLIIAAFMLVGCRCDNDEAWNDTGRISTIIEIDGNFRIMCDRSTNIAYLYYTGAGRAGITAYLNADRQPARCNEVSR